MEHTNETKDDDTVTVGPSGSKASKADHAVTVGSFGFKDDDIVILLVHLVQGLTIQTLKAP